MGEQGIDHQPPFTHDQRPGGDSTNAVVPASDGVHAGRSLAVSTASATE
jgi:hypothetical protein